MPKRRNYENIESRVYKRSRGGPPRYYADFRDFQDVGGGQEKLSAPGERFATTDPKEAKALAEARLAQFQERRKARPTGDAAKRKFGAFAAHHLEQQALWT